MERRKESDQGELNGISDFTEWSLLLQLRGKFTLVMQFVNKVTQRAREGAKHASVSPSSRATVEPLLRLSGNSFLLGYSVHRRLPLRAHLLWKIIEPVGLGGTNAPH